LRGAANYYKLAADQGIAAAQNNYGNCLDKGEGVSKDLSGETGDRHREAK
jgi:TPR repeat protein